MLDLLVIGNGGMLMLMCSNVHFRGVFYRFETPIKGYGVMESFVLLASFEFLVCVYG